MKKERHKTLSECSYEFSEALRNFVLEVAYSLKIDKLVMLLNTLLIGKKLKK